MTAPSQVPKGATLLRNPGIDVARGLAVLLMIETHAYDGWASAHARTTFTYHLTRVLSGIPAPLFLLLAGVGMALGTQAARRRGVGPAAQRGQLCRRGLQILGWGYLVSLAYAAIEGTFSFRTLLRADILHCIGLSLVLCALLLIGRTRLGLRAALLCAAALGISLLVPRLVSMGALPPALAVPLGLLVDVPPYTRFPLFPLVGFTALGVVTGQVLAAWQPSLRQGLLLSCAGIVLAAACTHATGLTVAALGGTLSRRHPAVVFNFLDGAARALAVLFLSLAAAPVFLRGEAWQAPSPLVRLGRGSLLAYAFHIPFCYGKLAAPLCHRLEMGAATVAVVLLSLLTYLAVRLRDLLRDAAARRKACRKQATQLPSSPCAPS